MRRSGVVADAAEVGAHSHVCFAFREPAELRAAAREFARTGMASGERVLLIAPPGEYHRWRSDEWFAEVLAGGQADLLQAETVYPRTLADPYAQVEYYSQETERALAAGYTGLRVAADATTLVGDPVALDGFARYEHLADVYMAAHPLSGLCAYARDVVPDTDLAQVASLHPTVTPQSSPFRLYAVGAGLAFAGELDHDAVALLEAALDRIRPDDGELVVDMTGLGFAHHGAVRSLERWAAGSGRRVLLRGARPLLRRLVELMELEAVRVEVAA
ncbi:MEDS domain-containing protein [Hamadaea tsunoensis]|uniref:MEDS domain-containing protein n=1 Tax=Hamadaea tsunoensis TaxID=53368 RepID=UPI000557F620|nr:MEDS domain-containing protein [Hamadaea tsunoensis]